MGHYPEQMLEERRTRVLRTLVEEYIRTGEPVSSRTIAEVADLGVSTATIRNDLASLERDGYVVQPHTSAGRMPTAAGYRYYVDHLGPAPAGIPDDTKIASFFGTVHLELTKLLKATSRLLAEVTQLPSVVVAPGVVGERIRDVHLVHLGPEQILSIVVTEQGRVLQERLRLPATVDTDELGEAERIISMAALGSGVGTRVSLGEQHRQGVSDRVWQTVAEVAGMIERVAGADNDVFVGGTGQLAAVWEDLSEVQRVLEVVEREAMIFNILARAPGTSIRIGSELPLTDVDMAVVSKTYETGSALGTLGVIGPMRMNYRRVISAVEEVTRELQDRIQA